MDEVSARYHKNVKGYTGWLRSKNVERRRKAAMMIGELGVEDAIPTLIQLAENDPDATVRENARYSLGMFLAFSDALESEDTTERETAIAAVQEMLSTGEIGKRASISAGRLRVFMGIFMVLLLLLIAANIGVFLMMDDPAGLRDLVGVQVADGGTPDANGGNTDAEDQDGVQLAGSGLALLSTLQENAVGLEAKLTPPSNGTQPGDGECPFGYTPAESLEISDANASDYPQIASAYQILNETLLLFDQTNAAVEEACLSIAPISQEDATDYLNEVQSFMADAPNLRAQLENAALPATETPVPQVAATTDPASEATATPAITSTPDFSSNIGQLYTIIDQVQGPRGANTILNNYWQEAADTNGQTNGCRIGRPDIPAPYQLLVNPEDAPDELVLAVNSVNVGLQTLRDGWSNFEEACAEGPVSLSGGASTGLQVATTVQATFETADLYLQQLRGISPPPTTNESE